MPEEGHDLVALTAEIVSAHVAHNSVHTGEVASLIGTVYEALLGLGAPEASPEKPKPQPATTARKSLSNPSHIISMIDGKAYKMLRRHLSRHGYTPETYREAFALPKDYPMVAAEHSERRREVAQKIGLGRRRKATRADAPSISTAPSERAAEPILAKRPRRKLSAAFGDAVSRAKGHLGGE